MRFAYMDSQGKEISIPSVDALALRIELGAITADTELYDAQADRWGPAHTHEIFHTLSRDAEEEGFVAPPPAMAPPPVDFGDALEADLDTEPEPEEEAAVEESESSDLDFSDMGLDLAPVLGAEDEVEEDDGGGFDFGDGLEMEAPVEDEPEVVSAGFEGAPEAPMDLLGGDMELESAIDFAGGTEDLGGALEMEKPMSEYTPEAPPDWMEEDDTGSAGQEAPIDFGGGQSTASGGDEPGREAALDRGDSRRVKREPRSRPSAPRRPRKVPVGLIVAAFILLGGGAVGFVAWQAFRGEEVAEAFTLPEVVIPDIPAELLPRMRDMAEAAVAEMIEDLRGRSEALEIPLQPQDAWLGGNYLANASQFEDIEQFWLGIELFVDDVRATDTQLFHDKYVAQVAAAGIAADTAAMLIERADSGFVAARDGRYEVYNLMDDLLNAALDLHIFLVESEDRIAYEPTSAGVSRDPVLEAVPDTEVLSDQMWGLVNGITDALADLGTLDRVTRERLFAVLFDRMRRAGIQ